jgi:hypothetical protein
MNDDWKVITFHFTSPNKHVYSATTNVLLLSRYPSQAVPIQITCGTVACQIHKDDATYNVWGGGSTDVALDWGSSRQHRVQWKQTIGCGHEWLYRGNPMWVCVCYAFERIDLRTVGVQWHCVYRDDDSSEDSLKIARTPRDSKDSKDLAPKDSKFPRLGRDSKDSKESKDPRIQKRLEGPKDSKDLKYWKIPRTKKDSKGQSNQRSKR